MMAQQTWGNLIQSYLEGGTIHKTPETYQVDIAKGNISGATVIHKFGRNPDADQNEVVDIWDGDAEWVAPTAARTHTIVSSNTADTSAGTGARTVQVYGLDQDYALANEVVTLGGTVGTVTSGSYNIIHRMIVRTAGDAGQNMGSITATAASDNTITAAILAGNNQTLMAIYQIPANKTGYMTGFYADMQRSVTTGACDIQLKEKPDGEVYQVKFVGGVVGAGSSYLERRYDVPRSIPAKTTIKMTATASANNTDVSAGFDIILVDD